MKSFILPRFAPDYGKIYAFHAPSSKSILNRALLLAAFSEGEVKIKCGAFGEDTKAMLNCLSALGVRTEAERDGIRVFGAGKRVPHGSAHLNVMSAGTCARFLPAVLSALGGDYTFDASEQMQRRPMDFLSELQKAGATLEFTKEKNRFPFRLISNGLKSSEFTADTKTSTQYASALLLAGAIGNRPLTLNLTGERTEGSYIQMTLSLIKAFGADWQRNGNAITVFPACRSPEEFEVETDVSAACYFYALSLLFGIKVLVRGVKKNSLQGDIRFLRLLEARGVRFSEREDGLLADGGGIAAFAGFEEDLCDFSDQLATIAALAPFASTPTRITGVGHVRNQESDRIAAIRTNLNALSVPCTGGKDFIEITPALPSGGKIKTFEDHRIAMAFALVGLKTGSVEIDDPACCNKTFEGYFEELLSIL